MLEGERGGKDYNDLKFSHFSNFSHFMPMYRAPSSLFDLEQRSADIKKKERQNPKCVQMLSSNLSDMNSMTLRVSFQLSSENLEMQIKVQKR